MKKFLWRDENQHLYRIPPPPHFPIFFHSCFFRQKFLFFINMKFVLEKMIKSKMGRGPLTISTFLQVGCGLLNYPPFKNYSLDCEKGERKNETFKWYEKIQKTKK